jgi:hypothetical protein
MQAHVPYQGTCLHNGDGNNPMKHALLENFSAFQPASERFI